MVSSCPDFLSRALDAVAKMPEEDRLRHAVQDVRDGNCSLRQTQRDWKVGYSKLQRRVQNSHSRAENGGNNTKLNTVEELALFGWINTQFGEMAGTAWRASDEVIN